MELTIGKEVNVIQQRAHGDTLNFKEIVETYKKKVFYLAYDLTGQVEDAEDLAQEVFVKAYRGLKNFKGGSAVGSWLYRITFNAFIDQKRKKSVRPEGQPQEMNERALDTPDNRLREHLGRIVDRHGYMDRF